MITGRFICKDEIPKKTSLTSVSPSQPPLQHLSCSCSASAEITRDFCRRRNLALATSLRKVRRGRRLGSAPAPLCGRANRIQSSPEVSLPVLISGPTDANDARLQTRPSANRNGFRGDVIRFHWLISERRALARTLPDDRV